MKPIERDALVFLLRLEARKLRDSFGGGDIWTGDPKDHPITLADEADAYANTIEALWNGAAGFT